MSAFDLLFIGAVLGTAICLLGILLAVVRGKWGTARRALLGWLIFAAVYLAVSIAVSYFRPQRVLAIGDSWCFDDWCLKIDRVDITPGRVNSRYDVRFMIFSRAGRATQRANGAWIYLIDEHGKLYSPLPDRSEVPLDATLHPMESVAASRVFDVSSGVRNLGLITGHGGPYCGTMSVLVIGDGGCWFGKPPMIRIQ